MNQLIFIEAPLSGHSLVHKRASVCQKNKNNQGAKPFKIRKIVNLDQKMQGISFRKGSAGPHRLGY